VKQLELNRETCIFLFLHRFVLGLTIKRALSHVNSFSFDSVNTHTHTHTLSILLYFSHSNNICSLWLSDSVLAHGSLFTTL